MEDATVIQIVDDNAKSGVSAKTNKPWSMSRVGLSNGESTFIFNPIEIGQVVEAVKDGEYINWRPKKPDPKHDEIMGALREIYKAITGGYPEKAEEPVVEVQTPAPAPKKPMSIKSMMWMRRSR